MPFTAFNTFLEATPKFKAKIEQLNRLLGELAKRDLPEHLITFINTELADINELQGTEKKDCRIVTNHQQRIIKKIEKDLKLVTKGYYKNMWMLLGMSAFGIPMGVAFGASMGNMGLLGLGLPIGMCIGMAVGACMDQKAAREGRQLDFK